MADPKIQDDMKNWKISDNGMEGQWNKERETICWAAWWSDGRSAGSGWASGSGIGQVSQEQYQHPQLMGKRKANLLKAE